MWPLLLLTWTERAHWMRQWLKTFSLLAKKKQKTVPHSNRCPKIPITGPDIWSICLHQIVGMDAFQDKLMWISNKICLSWCLIFASHADLAQSMPELDSALVYDKPVNTAADASPDVPPWPLCSSTVYIPSGIYREKNRNMWRKLRHLMAMRLQKCKLGKILPFWNFCYTWNYLLQTE